MPDDGERDRKVQKFLGKKYEPYVDYAKKLLFEKVNNVVISNRLTTEPCVVVADTYGHSSFMDKIQKAQMFSGANEDNPLSDFKKILEINPHHKVNQIILSKINVRIFFIQNNETDTELEELVELLYETAAFHSGFSSRNPNEFVKRFYQIYSKAMGVINLERKEMQIEEVELGEEDYEGDN
jgi:HSP90 family molecular chaperone